jgi:hypothetical protein
MIKKLLIGTFLLLFAFEVRAQETTKVIFDSQKESIVNYSQNNDLIGISTYESLGNGLMNDHLYIKNQNGEIIQHIEIKNAEYATKIKLMHSATNFICVNSSSNGQGNIIAYNIKSGKVLWKTDTEADPRIDISPDDKYALTTFNMGWFYGDEEIKLRIINLDDGSDLPLNKIFNNFYAAWFDNERIIVITEASSGLENSTIKLTLYNIKKQIIENERDIYSDSGSPLVRCGGDDDNRDIYISQDKDIFISAKDNSKIFLMKLDNNFRAKWNINILFQQLFTIESNNYFSFILENSHGFFNINNETGKLEESNDESINSLLRESSHKYIQFFNNIFLNKINNVLSIKREVVK